MDDKYGCYLFLKQFTDKVIPVYALIDNGEFYLLNPAGTLDALFARESKFILKPRKGRGGAGVMLLQVIDNEYYVDGKYVAEFSDTYKRLKNYILNPYIQQHPYAAKIYSNSLNSIRLLTCIQDGEVRIIRAGHRFGVERSGCVDNFSSGGIFTNIDLTTGVIENPVLWDDRRYRKCVVDEHPDTGEKITGVKVPNWERMTSQMMQLHQSIKFIKYVGWDIAITSEDFVIIEANYASDLIGLQLKTPLLVEEGNKKFFSLYR